MNNAGLIESIQPSSKLAVAGGQLQLNKTPENKSLGMQPSGDAGTANDIASNGPQVPKSTAATDDILKQKREMVLASLSKNRTAPKAASAVRKSSNEDMASESNPTRPDDAAMEELFAQVRSSGQVTNGTELSTNISQTSNDIAASTKSKIGTNMNEVHKIMTPPTEEQGIASTSYDNASTKAERAESTLLSESEPPSTKEHSQIKHDDRNKVDQPSAESRMSEDAEGGYIIREEQHDSRIRNQQLSREFPRTDHTDWETTRGPWKPIQARTVGTQQRLSSE